MKQYSERGLKCMTEERLKNVAKEVGISETIIGIQNKVQLVESVMKSLKGEIEKEAIEKKKVVKRVVTHGNPNHELLKEDEEREWIKENYIPGSPINDEWSETMKDEADAINAVAILVENKEIDETLLSSEMKDILKDLRKVGFEAIGITEEKVMNEQPKALKTKAEKIEKLPKEKKEKVELTGEYKRLEAAKNVEVPKGMELIARGDLKEGDVFTNVGNKAMKKVISFQKFEDGLILFTYCFNSDETKVETKRLAPYMPAYRLVGTTA